MGKKLSCLLAVGMLCLLMAIPVSAEGTSKRVVDDAGLLTSQDEQTLTELLNEISSRQDMDVVVVTKESTDGKRPADYADDYYDHGGYASDGVLLLVSMEDRDWYISTAGYGITAFTDAGIEYLSERFVSYLSDGDYNNAFTVYARLCDQFITQAKKGEPYDRGHLPKTPLSPLWFPVSLAVGILLALIVTGSMRSQLRSVRKQPGAADYVRRRSLRLTNSRELFLYRKTSRTEIQRDSDHRSGGGGSSTHTSSSGATHGGGGGKF